MKRFLITTIFLLITATSFSQKLDAYKYVVIPYKFNYLKKHDQYRVNSLVRFLFKKEGFKVLYDSEEFPQDLADDRCLALFADIEDDSGMFITKTKIILRDCANKIVLETQEGITRIKEYEKAYNETLRKAFESITAQNYTYTPSTKEKPVIEVKTILTETVTERTKIETPKTETVTVTEVQTKPVQPVQPTKSSVLYAQPLQNGYQLVDNTPKVVMILLKSGVPDVFLVKGKDAVVYKKNGKWILSNASTTGNEESVLNVKF